MISAQEIRSLAQIRSDGAPVVSCHLDVDGRRFVRAADYERILDNLLRRVRAERDGHRGNGADEADLIRIEKHIREGFERKGVRGLAIFSCSEIDLWTVIELPVPVRSQVVCNPTPAVGQLESIVEEAEPIGVLLADKQHVRAFVFSLGEIVEHTEELDELPRDYDRVGEADRGSVEPHRSELEHQHIRHAAQVAFDLLQQRPFAHLVIGAPNGLASELEGALHPYLSERLRGRLDIPTTASLAQLREKALEIELQIEREREAAVVHSLREAVGADNRGVAGINDVLDALADHRVERLLVSDGFTAAGWACGACGRLASTGPTCACGTDMHAVDNVVDEAIEVALGSSTQVEVCVDNADLDVLGRIGALLRY